MLQQERINDEQDALRVALQSFRRTLWCAMVGIITDTSNYASQGTVTVELAIQATIIDAQGNETQQTIRPIVDVPVVFIGGGNMVTTYPVADGDETLIIFADRAIDYWFAKGSVQRAANSRSHDLTDAIAIVGPRSLAKSLANLSTDTAQFRTIDGSTYFEVASGGKTNIVAPGGVTITGPVAITGDVSITGKVTATKEGTFNSIPVSTHLHTGVQTGGSDTGAPIV